MVVFGESGFVQVNMVVLWQSGCVRAKVVVFSKVVVFGERCLYSGKVFWFG